MKLIGSFATVKNIIAQKPRQQEQIAKHVFDEIVQQTVDELQNKASDWISENKLVHAGAALKLASELKNKK